MQRFSGSPTSGVPVSGSGPACREGKPGRPAIVLICDRNYLLPTFATALSADHHSRGGRTAVLLFVVDADDAWVRQFDDAVAGTRIEIRPAPLPQLADLARYHEDRYLPPIALARLWIDTLLEPGIDRFLYMDGDTMADAELDSLLADEPPAEGLMAAPDCLRLFLDELGIAKRQDIAYLEGLGCAPGTYFNSGVIYTARAAWRDIVPAALEFLTGHPERCRASDQSALNHAARGKVRLLSLRYNFQTEHKMVLDPRHAGITPAIWHFTGGPKPWDAPGWPWDDYFNRFYREAEARVQGRDVATPVAPEAQTVAGIGHRSRTRRRLNWVLPLRKRSRRYKIIDQLGFQADAPAPQA